MNHASLPQRLALLFLILATVSVKAFCGSPGSAVSRGLIESDEVRSRIFEPWLAEELSRVLLLKPAVYTDRYVYSFTVSQKKNPQEGLLEIMVRPDAERGVRGTWILDRKLSDGLPRRIRVYPVDDPAIFVVLESSGGDPERDRSLLSLWIYGLPVCREIPVGLPLVRLYTQPFASLVSMTRSTVPWDLLEPDPARYRDIESTEGVIRERIGTLVYLDDGAFDEDGKPVLIEDGSPQDPQTVLKEISPGQDISLIEGGVNCSGFAKWVVDGIIRPVAGSSLKIQSLKGPTDAPNTHFTAPFREQRDLFFALDWTRHLASAAVSLAARSTFLPGDSGVDVTIEPFPGTTGYEKNVGYRADVLIPLMYVLAVREPGNLYLGAISHVRGDPPLRQYHHVAVLLPRFDAEGRFRFSVFESAVETRPEDLVSRNLDGFVHLVRVRVPEKGNFQP